VSVTAGRGWPQHGLRPFFVLTLPMPLFFLTRSLICSCALFSRSSEPASAHSLTLRSQAFPTDTTINPRSFVGLITIAVTEAPWPPTDILLNGASVLTIREDTSVVRGELVCWPHCPVHARGWDYPALMSKPMCAEHQSADMHVCLKIACCTRTGVRVPLMSGRSAC
jgi:hypothetical protein